MKRQTVSLTDEENDELWDGQISIGSNSQKFIIDFDSLCFDIPLFRLVGLCLSFAQIAQVAHRTYGSLRPTALALPVPQRASTILQPPQRQRRNPELFRSNTVTERLFLVQSLQMMVSIFIEGTFFRVMHAKGISQ